MRRAFTDRNTYLGDPAFVKNPLGPAAVEAVRRGAAEAPSATVLRRPRCSTRHFASGASTTHYSVVDAEGNAVSCTTTLNDSYGSAVTVTGAGFLLNDEMDDFATAPGKPNMYGLVQGEANAIAPGKRMLSAMTPEHRARLAQPALHGGGDARRAAHHHDGLPRDLERHRSSHVARRCGGRAAHAPPGPARHAARRRRRCSPRPRSTVSEPAGTPCRAPAAGAMFEAIIRTTDGWQGVSDGRYGGGGAGY